MSRTLSMSNGSVDNLNVSLRCGCKPKARQMRLTVDRLMPLAFAMSRTLQCVAPAGVVSSVRMTTCSICSSSMRLGVPGRGSSNSPSCRSSRNRVRHLHTVVGDTCKRFATLVVSRSSAHARMIRARRATCGALRDRWASDSRRCRSSRVSVNGVLGRPVRMLALLIEQYDRPHYLFHLLLRQDTS